MFAIEVEYLLGRAVATDPHNRDRAEWPPHPGRLYSALVDAHSAAPSAAGEAALRWLEAQPAPSMCVDWGESVSLRQVVKHFVPANDDVQSKEAPQSPLVDRRERKERYFPAAVPTRSTVRFIWSVDAGEHLAALRALAAELVYLGHSSSLIAARVTDGADVPDLVPDEDGEIRLRVPAPGRLDRLVQVHEARRAWPSQRMQWVSRAGASRTCAYRKPLPSSPSTSDSCTRRFSKRKTQWPPVKH